METSESIHGRIPVLQLGEFLLPSEDSFIYVNRLSEHLRRNHLLISHPHKHDFYLTVLFTQGSGYHEVDFQRYSVVPGTVFLLKPGQSHHWQLSADTDGFIFFHTQLVNGYFYRDHFPFHAFTDVPPLLFLERGQMGSFAPKFNALLEEYRVSGEFRERKLTNLIDNLYIDLSRHYHSPQEGVTTTASGMHYLRQFEDLLEEHFREEKSPHAYAAWLSISVRHLSRLTQEHYGKSSGTLIAERVILEAKRMIAHTEDRLQEIARELGFEEYTYFSRFFKKHTNFSPRQFEQSVRFKKM